VKNPAVYKCPTDRSTSKFAGITYPRVRTISMSQMIRPKTQTDGHSTSPPWTIYSKYSDMIRPPPVNLWVFLDENPDSVNDAAFAVKMDLQGPSACWQDGPSILHNGGCGFSFADGHSEIRKWKDSRSVSRPMQTTYVGGFNFGLTQPNNPDIAWVQARTSARR
jgi:prepilin-type processing-associated H-X9-DG protein